MEQAVFYHQPTQYSDMAEATVPAQRQALFRRDQNPPPWHLTQPLELTKGRSAFTELRLPFYHDSNHQRSHGDDDEFHR